MLQKWLEAKQVAFTQKTKRAELWALAKQKSLEDPKFKVDDLIRSFGHEPLRLPPYHCDLNPIGKLQLSDTRWLLVKLRQLSS